MIKRRQIIIYGLIILAIIFFTVWGRHSTNIETVDGIITAKAFSRELFFIILFTSWGAYTYYRCVDKKIKYILTSVAMLSVMWILLSVFRKYIFFDEEVKRLLWYSYYIPMLYIPVLSLSLSFRLGKKESDIKDSKLRVTPTIISTILIIIVLTNDLHHLIFITHGTSSGHLNVYEYAPLYYVLLAWMFLSSFTAMGILIHKIRKKETRKLSPIPIFFAILLLSYAVLYVLGYMNDGFFSYFRPIAVYQNLIIISLYESVILCGMIPLCTKYGQFFANTNIYLEIKDRKGNMKYMTKAKEPKEAITLIHTIKGGEVVYKKDIYELNKMKKELAAKKDQLIERNRQLSYEQKVRSELSAILYRHQLGREAENLFTEKIEEVSRLIENIPQGSSLEEKEIRNHTLRKINILVSYIKRMCNLLFISKEEGRISTGDLELSILESMHQVKLAGAECACINTSGIQSLPTQDAMMCFDWYEEIIENYIEKDFEALLVNMVSLGDTFRMVAMVETEKDFRPSEKLLERIRIREAINACHEMDNSQIITLTFAVEEKSQ